jgi:prepilin-type processing-associated H-X9-DG protein
LIGGTADAPYPLPSIHSQIVIVTFCDGHVESLANDIFCNINSASPPDNPVIYALP